MRIGLDFDNTIVCYDEAIKILVEKLFELPSELQRTKLEVRDFLRAAGREQEWIAFQGELYGPGMKYAEPFEDAIATMLQLQGDGHELVIVSHRSCRPYAGHPHDLHLAARAWVADHLQRAGLFGNVGDKNYVHFLETRDQKVSKVAELGCRVFIDDLPEVLTAPGFPPDTHPILFAPLREGALAKQDNNAVIYSWCKLPQLISALAL